MNALRKIKRYVRELPWRWRNSRRSSFLRRAALQCSLRTGIEPVFKDWADWIVFLDVFVEGDYDVAIRRAIASAPPDRPALILDIGANIGLFTLRCCHLRRLERPSAAVKIHQFEASAATFQRLREQMQQQPFTAEE